MELQPTFEPTPLVKEQPTFEWLDRSGPNARSIAQFLTGMVGPKVVPTAVEKKPTVEEELFVASADAKIWASRVSMKLPKGVRERLFRQLDMLHDADEWMDDGKPINLESFQSLVRSILVHKIKSNPALALMPNGNIVALWEAHTSRLSVEFLPTGKVRWSVQAEVDGSEERAAGLASIVRLREILAPFGGGIWFDGS